jgi:hypothetical protein
LLQSEVHQKQTAQNYERPKELLLRTTKYTAPEMIPIKVKTRIREKNGSTEHSKGNKTVAGKVATTRTEDGHKLNTKTSATI